jgi:hypothetical protein
VQPALLSAEVVPVLVLVSVPVSVPVVQKLPVLRPQAEDQDTQEQLQKPAMPVSENRH